MVVAFHKQLHVDIKLLNLVQIVVSPSMPPDTIYKNAVPTMLRPKLEVPVLGDDGCLNVASHPVIRARHLLVLELDVAHMPSQNELTSILVIEGHSVKSLIMRIASGMRSPRVSDVGTLGLVATANATRVNRLGWLAVRMCSSVAILAQKPTQTSLTWRAA